jgi:hypothetical protein
MTILHWIITLNKKRWKYYEQKIKVVFYYVRETWFEMFMYCYKQWQKKPIFTFTWRLKMAFDVTICKFRMHLSWYTLRRWGCVYYNCLFFNCIWHLSCFSCTFRPRKHPKIKSKLFFRKTKKPSEEKKSSFKKKSLKYLLYLLQQGKFIWSIGRWWGVDLSSSFAVE